MGVRISPPVLGKTIVMEKLKTYLQSSYEEFAKHSTWPTWAELQKSTVLVIVASLMFSLVVFAMDKSLAGALDFLYSLFA
jgi:preprotein translocase subunit SecE